MKTLRLFLTTIAVFLFTALPVFAGQYDGEQPSPDILIDKMVGIPHSTKGGDVTYSYVDNLSTSDHRFGPQDYIYFKVRIKNTSDITLHDVVVTDFAPEHVDLFENPGSLNGRDIKINAGTLKPNEEKEYVLKGRIKHQDNLPADKALFCEFNTVRASNNSVFDEDSSQFCIEKEVTPGEEVPEAGAAHGVLITVMAGASALAGLKLRRFRA